jgi:class 3 adenylate cyclase/tetratricopeptide (TPR) repeat protein
VVEQRRIVTSLFCDLVGFTATSEEADPEDLHRMLAAYEAMARAEIERHGGTVEKFIGDAVVGVFGIPTAHEDDPVRAVRAALAITAGAANLRQPDGSALRLRVGINTGEVLAQLSVDPASGERFFIGDAANTAARIQSVAPEMSAAVGESTYEATRRAFAYEPLPAVSVKGKAEPLAMYRVVEGQRAPAPEADIARLPYVGREDELARLIAFFDSAANGTRATLVTIIGEAGMGKSRLVAELGRHVHDRVPNARWLRGRCLPYGDGITFWALGEIVKGRAGILESDSPETAREKLAASIGDVEDAAWVLERVLPLVGVDGANPAEREELFGGWLRYLESIAADEPAVFLFEDLHWADASLLEFLEYACTEARRGLLLVATARPDLLERQPDFGKAVRAERLELVPLEVADAMVLAAAILGGTPAPDLADAISRRSDGNPLYVEEYARLLRDRDLLTMRGGVVTIRAGVEVPVPGSIHALLAARLDTLTPEHRAVLADAAVVGKTFWSGAVAVLGGREPQTLRAELAELEGLGFVRQVLPSSMADENEYTFSHVLVRDVAYGQLPRAMRASRHRGVATWLEEKLGNRVEDIADVLADHWHTALELATASGQAEEAAEVAPHTLRFLVLAADRAQGLDWAGAARQLERALVLAPPGHPMRPDVLLRFGEATQQLARFEESERALDEAIAAFDASGDWRDGARSRQIRAITLLATNRSEEYQEAIADAVERLEQHEPTPELLSALTEVAIDTMYDGDPAAAIEMLDRCLALATELGMPTPARVLGFRGNGRAQLGDAGGIQEMYRAVELATAAGQGREAIVEKINISNWLASYEGPHRALELAREAIADAQQRGLLMLAFGMRRILGQYLYQSGDYDAALQVFDELAEDAGTGASSLGSVPYRIRAVRGAIPEAECDAILDDFEEMARPEFAITSQPVRIAGYAWLCWSLGRRERALAALRDLASCLEGGDRLVEEAVNVDVLTRIARDAGDLQLARRLVARAGMPYPAAQAELIAARAVIAERSEDEGLQAALVLYRDAADRFASLGLPLEEANARVGMARCLIGLGRTDESQEPIAVAGAVAARLGSLPLAADIAAAQSLVQPSAHDGLIGTPPSGAVPG